MAKASILLPILVALCGVVVLNCASSQAAPAPSVDCTGLILTLADCLPFVTNGSKDTKPQGSCCTGLKTVLKTNAECLCEAFKNSASFGVALNVTKAVTLPAACGVSAPSASNCGLSLVAGSPAQSPKASAPKASVPKSAPTPMSPKSPAEAPVEEATINQVPAPAPGVSGASLVPVSFAALALSLVVAASSSYF